MKHYARLFVAVPLPGLLTEELVTYLPAYEKPGVRIIPEENWHLTVHFIGNVPKTQVPEIAEKLNTLAPQLENFELKLLRVAPGPNAKMPRLIWAEFAANQAFEKMVRAVTFALGAKMDHQHPVAHVTLARFAKDIRPPKMPQTPAKENTLFPVQEISLWESELRKPHPHYTILERYTLGNKNPEPENN
ncbi:RNA 2',3'-cyclic phosphodiesterase [Adhaeribacter sp. BT258]|uniref:RNA 2',3'-cyclic phosphodiesterase n=1 Tax=Adhaeribacter terrigena TaxID=2793070 RepID=A0ABS1BY19_9BACT|nr:RNA 2',3'-cyclic phosphodiesterase [Adhaeribacter terrigena]MBK0402046.1 RNA 2',3'-cyclic phosphodiesterase [Adhaeribacter terrigena]